MGAYSAKDLEGGDELQIRFQPLLLCPNLHQGLIAKAVCEYVPEVERSDNCDDVVRGVTPREVSVIVSLLSRKYNGSPSRNAERDLKSSCCCKLCHTHTHTHTHTHSIVDDFIVISNPGRIIVGPQFSEQFRQHAQSELGPNFERLAEGCQTVRGHCC